MVIKDIVRKNTSFIEKTIAFNSALRPVLSMDPLTGEPSVSITIEPSQEDITIRSIFNYLNESGKEVYIAIDEFQQIVDPLTGEPSVSITIEPSQEDITIRSIFNYLNESGKEVYIAIDEFQQIAEYPEKGTEALLRSYIQFAQHVHFIFYGSKHHLMAVIFGSPIHPFYQSTDMMGLKPFQRKAQRHCYVLISSLPNMCISSSPAASII